MYDDINCLCIVSICFIYCTPTCLFTFCKLGNFYRPLKQGPPPLAPLRRKHLSVPSLKLEQESVRPDSSLTSVTDADRASQSSLERYHLKQAKRNKRAQERVGYVGIFLQEFYRRCVGV